MSAVPTPSATPRRPRRWLRRTGWALLGLLAAGGVALGGALAWYAPQLPPLDKVTAYQPREPLQVYTSDGVELAQFGTERRQFTPIAQMPLPLRQAVLAVEDARFYEHPGIDAKGVLRALVANATGGLRQGASTITQQVARTFFLSSRLTPERKLKEALLALRIERQLGKDQILELYMNQIYLGQRAYGFAAAADTYFGKPLAALSLAETAVLAGLPQNPAYANPITNLERALRRQRVVLARMVATGAVTAQQADAARAEVLKLRSPLQVALHGEHVAEMARQAVVDRFGAEVYSQGIRVYTALRAADQQAAWAALRRGVLAYDARQPWRGPEGEVALPSLERADAAEVERAAAHALKDFRDDEQLRVAIVLHASPRALRVQLATGEQLPIVGDGLLAARAGLAAGAPADIALRRGAVIRVAVVPPTTSTTTPATAPGPATGSAVAAATPGSTWRVVQWPEAQAAFVALDPDSGRVRAMVGGFDFNRQPFNHVTQAKRQPGSAFKPFLYSAALDHGLMPATQVNDAPLDTADGWSPQNSDGRYDGPVTLREALARSKNTVSIRVLQHIGVPQALAWAGRFGFDTRAQPTNLTLALGAGSTTPLQLAQAYAVLANGGWRVAPVVIERITDARGKVLFEAPPAPPRDETNRAVPERNVWLTNSLLNDVTRIGTAARVQQQLKRADLYGKTGTTNDAVDAWFAGFLPSVRSGVPGAAGPAAGSGGAGPAASGSGAGPAASSSGAGRAGSGSVAGRAASSSVAGRAGLVAVAWVGYDQPQSLGERETGGGLALPIWVDYMQHALKDLPAAPAPAPSEGLVLVDGDWRYSEWAEAGAVWGIGLPPPEVVGPETAASSPAEAASAMPPTLANAVAVPPSVLAAPAKNP